METKPQEKEVARKVAELVTAYGPHELGRVEEELRGIRRAHGSAVSWSIVVSILGTHPWPPGVDEPVKTLTEVYGPIWHRIQQ